MQLNTLALCAALLAVAHAAPSPFKIDLSLDIKDMNSAENDVCWKICYYEKMKCPNAWYSKQFGDCWTCCKDLSSAEIGLEGNNLVETSVTKEDSSMKMSLKNENASGSPICLAVCYYDKPKCASGWYAMKMRECWTCCTDRTALELGSEDSDSFESAMMKDCSLVDTNFKKIIAPVTTLDICLHVCFPEKPQCPSNWYPSSSYGEECWTCCRSPTAKAIETTKHDPQLPAVDDVLASISVSGKQFTSEDREICYMMCMPEAPSCGEKMYPKKFGDCWTCCTKIDYKFINHFARKNL